jgi:hypothetical protein
LLQLGLQLEAPERVFPHAFEDLANRAESIAPGPIEAMPTLRADVDESGRHETPELQ